MSSQRPSARLAILDAARRLLETNGAAVSLEEVARAAGVSRQAIYLHFASRNDLILAVADEARNRADIPQRAAELETARTPRELLAGICRIAVAFYPETAAAQLAIEALCRMDAELAALWSRRTAGRITIAQRAVERLGSAGALAVPQDRARDLLWALTGPSLYDQLVVRSGWPLHDYEAQLVRTLLATLVLPSAADAPFPAATGRAEPSQTT